MKKKLFQYRKGERKRVPAAAGLGKNCPRVPMEKTPLLVGGKEESLPSEKKKKRGRNCTTGRRRLYSRRKGEKKTGHGEKKKTKTVIRRTPFLLRKREKEGSKNLGPREKGSRRGKLLLSVGRKKRSSPLFKGKRKRFPKEHVYISWPWANLFYKEERGGSPVWCKWGPETELFGEGGKGPASSGEKSGLNPGNVGPKKRQCLNGDSLKRKRQPQLLVIEKKSTRQEEKKQLGNSATSPTSAKTTARGPAGKEGRRVLIRGSKLRDSRLQRGSHCVTREIGQDVELSRGKKRL